MSIDNDQERSVRKQQCTARKSFFNFHCQTFFTFLAASVPSHSPMAYNKPASLNKLLCTKNVDFGKLQDKFIQFFSFKNHSKYLDVKFKVFKRDEIRSFRLVQRLTNKEANSKHLMQLRNQLVFAAENLGKKTKKFVPSADTNNVQKHG